MRGVPLSCADGPSSSTEKIAISSRTNPTNRKGRTCADDSGKGYVSTDELSMDTSSTTQRFNPLVQLKERMKLSLSGRKPAVTSPPSLKTVGKPTRLEVVPPEHMELGGRRRSLSCGEWEITSSLSARGLSREADPVRLESLPDAPGVLADESIKWQRQSDPSLQETPAAGDAEEEAPATPPAQPSQFKFVTTGLEIGFRDDISPTLEAVEGEKVPVGLPCGFMQFFNNEEVTGLGNRGAVPPVLHGGKAGLPVRKRRDIFKADGLARSMDDGTLNSGLSTRLTQLKKRVQSSTKLGAASNAATLGAKKNSRDEKSVAPRGGRRRSASNSESSSLSSHGFSGAGLHREDTVRDACRVGSGEASAASGAAPTGQVRNSRSSDALSHHVRVLVGLHAASGAASCNDFTGAPCEQQAACGQQILRTSPAAPSDAGSSHSQERRVPMLLLQTQSDAPLPGPDSNLSPSGPAGQEQPAAPRTGAPRGFIEFLRQTDLEREGVAVKHAANALVLKPIRVPPGIQHELAVQLPSTPPTPGHFHIASFATFDEKPEGKPIGLFYDAEDMLDTMMKLNKAREKAREEAREREEREKVKERGKREREEREKADRQRRQERARAPPTVSISEPKGLKRQSDRERNVSESTNVLPVEVLLELIFSPDTDKSTVEAVVACHQAFLSTRCFISCLRDQINRKNAAAVDILFFLVQHPDALPGNLQKYSSMVKAMQGCGMAKCAESQKKLNAIRLALLKACTSSQKVTTRQDEIDFNDVVGAPSLDRLSPKELVLWWTYLDHRLYCAITCEDMLAAVNKKSKAVEEFVARSNQMSYWVATQILAFEDVASRAECISRFIDCLKECVGAQNFNSFMVVNAGLNCASISRLKRSWELVGARQLAAFEVLQAWADTSTNYHQYRAALSTTDKPAVPFLGIFLRDLTFVFEGKKLRVKRSESEDVPLLPRSLTEPNSRHQSPARGSLSVSLEGIQTTGRVRRLTIGEVEAFPVCTADSPAHLTLSRSEDLSRECGDVFTPSSGSLRSRCHTLKALPAGLNTPQKGKSDDVLASPPLPRRTSSRDVLARRLNNVTHAPSCESGPVAVPTHKEGSVAAGGLTMCERPEDPDGQGQVKIRRYKSSQISRDDLFQGDDCPQSPQSVESSSPGEKHAEGGCLGLSSSAGARESRDPLSKSWKQNLDYDQCVNLTLIQQIWPILRLFKKFQA